ncbi:MAG: POTRA domain-containing protein [Candidatus Omnitrophota bacterium]
MKKIKKIACLILLFTQLNPAFHRLSAVTVGEIEKSQQDIDKELSLRRKIEQPEKVFVKKIVLPQGCLIPKDEFERINRRFAGHWLTAQEIQELLDALTQAYIRVYPGSKPPNTAYVIEKGKLVINF